MKNRNTLAMRFVSLAIRKEALSVLALSTGLRYVFNIHCIYMSNIKNYFVIDICMAECCTVPCKYRPEVPNFNSVLWM